MHRNIRGTVIPILNNQGDLKKKHNKTEKTHTKKPPKQTETPNLKD